MGRPDHFAKRTFVEDATRVTKGAASWQDAPEIWLERVQADGMLMVHRPAALREICAPWCLAAAHDEVLIELKMQGDHVARAAIARALLRRQAREVQRIEQVKPGKPPWLAHEPLWLVSGYLPRWVVDLYTPEQIERGCYRVFGSPFDFFWIASNELPLQDELVPFLMTRTGKSLVEFAEWVVNRKPLEWCKEMLDSLPMNAAKVEHLKRILGKYQETPEGRKLLKEYTWALFGAFPSLREDFLTPEEREAFERMLQLKQEAEEAELRDARHMLRRVLKVRKFVVSPMRECRIDDCDDIDKLRRWHDKAVLAESVDDVFK